MKRSFFIRIIALAISVALLTGTLVVAAVTGSPYEILKKAVLNVGSLTSHSFNASIRATLDGKTLETEDQYYEYVDGKYNMSISNGHISYETEDGTLSIFGDHGSYFTKTGNMQVQNYFLGMNFADEDPRYIRLAEMAADLIIGDIKNNITMTETGDMRHISGTLTASQIPELYNAALELIMAENGSSYQSISNGFDMSTFNPDNLTIRHTAVYLQNMKFYEDISECELHPLDVNTFYDQLMLKSMQDREYVGGILYIDGVYYESWNYTTLSQTEKDLSEAEYKSYMKEGDMPPVSTARVTYVHGEADVDQDGLLRGVKGNASIAIQDVFGNQHDFEFNVNIEINKITETSNPEYERLMKAVAAHVPEEDKYYDISFTLDAYGNPVIENIYDGWSSNGYTQSGYETEAPQAYPADDYALWIEKRIDELAGDPIYTGVAVEVLEIIARNEWEILFGTAA